jgi:hypothetical protein
VTGPRVYNFLSLGADMLSSRATPSGVCLMTHPRALLVPSGVLSAAACTYRHTLGASASQHLGVQRSRRSRCGVLRGTHLAFLHPTSTTCA